MADPIYLSMPEFTALVKGYNDKYGSHYGLDGVSFPDRLVITKDMRYGTFNESVALPGEYWPAPPDNTATTLHDPDCPAARNPDYICICKTPQEREVERKHEWLPELLELANEPGRFERVNKAASDTVSFPPSREENLKTVRDWKMKQAVERANKAIDDAVAIRQHDPRSIELLTTGDLIRDMRDKAFWYVRGVYGADDLPGSKVVEVIALDAPASAMVMRIPMSMIDGHCDVYLKVRK